MSEVFVFVFVLLTVIHLIPAIPAIPAIRSKSILQLLATELPTELMSQVEKNLTIIIMILMIFIFLIFLLILLILITLSIDIFLHSRHQPCLDGNLAENPFLPLHPIAAVKVTITITITITMVKSDINMVLTSMGNTPRRWTSWWDSTRTRA